MSGAFLVLIVAVALTIMVRGLILSRVAYLTVPFLVSAIILVWLVPQALSAANMVGQLPAGGVLVLHLMALGTLGAVAIGWRLAPWGPPSVPPQRGETPLAAMLRAAHEERLVLVVGAFVAFALLVQAAIQMLPPAQLLARQPSGLVTILRFLQTVNPVAFVLAFSYVLVRRNVFSVMLFVLSLLTFAAPVLLNFKRNEIVELGIAGAFTLWAVRGFALPRVVLPLLAVCGLVVLFGVSEFRARSGYVLNEAGQVERRLPPLSELLEIDWPDVIATKFSQQSQEYNNAVHYIAHIDRSGDFGLGRRFWNQVIKDWLPGQFVGTELKASFFFNTVTLSDALGAFSVSWMVGTTATGFSDVYFDFSLLGVLVFLVNAWIAGLAYRKGLRGHLDMAAIYPSLAAANVVAVTHGGYTLLILLPLLLGARYAIRWSLAPPRRMRRRATPAPTRNSPSGVPSGQSMGL